MVMFGIFLNFTYFTVTSTTGCTTSTVAYFVRNRLYRNIFKGRMDITQFAT